MKVREFSTEQWLSVPLDTVFAFFGDAGNLDAITPPWLHFKILTPQPIEMGQGTLIDYRIRIHGIPIRWRTRINAWEPPFRFVDEQISGPYRLWIHEHTFAERDGGTLIRDVVRYATPFDALLHDRFVRPDIERIFAFRKEAIERHFPCSGVKDLPSLARY